MLVSGRSARACTRSGVPPCPVWASHRSGAQAVECGMEDWLEVAGVAVDHGDGDDHVEDLLEGEVVADLASALRGGEEWLACGDHPGAVVAEYRVAAVPCARAVRKLCGACS